MRNEQKIEINIFDYFDLSEFQGQTITDTLNMELADHIIHIVNEMGSNNLRYSVVVDTPMNLGIAYVATFTTYGNDNNYILRRILKKLRLCRKMERHKCVI